MTKKKDRKGRKSLFKRLERAEAVSVPPSPSHSPPVQKNPDNISTVLDAKVTVTANFDVKVEGRKVPDPVRKNFGNESEFLFVLKSLFSKVFIYFVVFWLKQKPFRR